MLAHMPQAELNKILDGPFPAPLTKTSAQSADTLLSEIDETRKRGFSVDNGQVRSGMCCLGAAVRNASGEAVAGVALSMTTAEAHPDVMDATGRAISDFALLLSRRIGFRN